MNYIIQEMICQDYIKEEIRKTFLNNAYPIFTKLINKFKIEKEINMTIQNIIINLIKAVYVNFTYTAFIKLPKFICPLIVVIIIHIVSPKSH